MTAFDWDLYAPEWEKPLEKKEGGVPDGEYQVSIEKAQLTATKQTGEPMVAFQLRVLGPKCRGAVIFKNSVIRPTTAAFIRRDLANIGFDLPHPSKIAGALEAMINMTIEIKQQTKGGKFGHGDMVNVYFQRALAREDAPNNDIPF